MTQIKGVFSAPLYIKLTIEKKIEITIQMQNQVKIIKKSERLLLWDKPLFKHGQKSHNWCTDTVAAGWFDVP